MAPMPISIPVSALQTEPSFDILLPSQPNLPVKNNFTFEQPSKEPLKNSAGNHRGSCKSHSIFFLLFFSLVLLISS